MNRRTLAVLGTLLVCGVLGYATLRYIAARESRFCNACSRPIHQLSRTVAIADGRKTYYCCPSCALFEHQQAGKAIAVIELADHAGGGVLSPANSYVVRDSDVNLCHQHKPNVSADKQPMHSHFDRCAPSILAFRDRTSAEAFAGEHGGQVFRFADLARESVIERTR